MRAWLDVITEELGGVIRIGLDAEGRAAVSIGYLTIS